MKGKLSKIALFCLVVMMLACVAPAQVSQRTLVDTPPPGEVWMRLAGGAKADQSWAVETDPQGNLYWGTFQQEPGQFYTDLVIYKFDSQGGLLWEQHYGGPFQEKVFVLAVTPPYLLVGGEQDHSVDITQSDMLVLALNLKDGKVAWEFSYDQGVGYEEVDGLVADDDFIYVSGWTTSPQKGNDLGLLKLDRQGHLIWAQAWGGIGWDEANGQMVVDQTFIYVTGRTEGQNFLSGGYGLLAKFRKDTGEYVQSHTWNTAQFYDGFGMTSDGSYLYVTGLTLVPRPGLPADGQIFVQKWDKQFNLLWERQWGGTGGDQARAIGVDDAGRVIVAGNTTMAGDHQVVLLVFDGAGELLNETMWGGQQNDMVHGLWVEGEYAYLAGKTASQGEGMSDALLLRVHIPSASFPAMP